MRDPGELREELERLLQVRKVRCGRTGTDRDEAVKNEAKQSESATWKGIVLKRERAGGHAEQGRADVTHSRTVLGLPCMDSEPEPSLRRPLQCLWDRGTHTRRK